MNNNEARKLFKEFISEYGLERSGNRNVFKDSGKLWAFCADNSAKVLRQFYDDCSGIYQNGEFIDKDSIKLGAVTRVAPSGLKAYNAHF